MAQAVEKMGAEALGFNMMASLPESVLAGCVARKDSWEPASRRYRDIEVIEVSK